MSALPTCAKCSKPVDSFEWFDNDALQERTYIAKCHGREERTVLHFTQIAGIDPHAIASANPFRIELLSGPCHLGMGCGEAGMCYALAMDRPDQCGMREPERTDESHHRL